MGEGGKNPLGNPVSVLIISSYVNQVFAVRVDYIKDKRYQKMPDRMQHK